MVIRSNCIKILLISRSPDNLRRQPRHYAHIVPVRLLRMPPVTRTMEVFGRLWSTYAPGWRAKLLQRAGSPPTPASPTLTRLTRTMIAGRPPGSRSPISTTCGVFKTPAGRSRGTCALAPTGQWDGIDGTMGSMGSELLRVCRARERIHRATTTVSAVAGRRLRSRCRSACGNDGQVDDGSRRRYTRSQEPINAINNTKIEDGKLGS